MCRLQVRKLGCNPQDPRLAKELFPGIAGCYCPKENIAKVLTQQLNIVAWKQHTSLLLITPWLERPVPWQTFSTYEGGRTRIIWQSAPCSESQGLRIAESSNSQTIGEGIRNAKGEGQRNTFED